MSNVVDLFNRQSPAAVRAKAAMNSGMCEIVIFPGVRYERWSTGDAPKESEPSPAKARGRKRSKRQRA